MIAQTIKITDKKIKRRPERNILTSRSGFEKGLYVFIFILFSIYAATLILPFVWLLIQSLCIASKYELFRNSFGSFSFPTGRFFAGLKNYSLAFTQMQYQGTNLLVMLFNSIWYIALGLLWCTIWPVITGYILSKYTFKGRNTIYAVAIFTLTVPLVGSNAFSYVMYDFLGIYDKGPLFVMVTGVNGFSSSFLIYYGIFKGISWSYAESVFIDGGGNFTAFVKVMLPQALPAIGALMIGSAITMWNEYYSIMMFMPSTPTIAVGLYFLSNNVTRFGRPMYYAGLLMSLLPIMVLYGFSADKMMKNLSIGGLKG